jgi:hypothetical protein
MTRPMYSLTLLLLYAIKISNKIIGIEYIAVHICIIKHLKGPVHFYDDF